MKSHKHRPTLSIIVIFHDMCREAKRTLYTLSTSYQNDVSATDYEVIAIDNGSKRPLDPDWTREFGPNFKHYFFKTDSVSPVEAINHGVGVAVGEFIAVIVDGARMVTPGLISISLRALAAFSNPFVGTLAWHLGPDVQNVSMGKGYDQTAEDQLLESIEWRNNGYQLFGISTLAQSSRVGFFGGLPAEFSYFAIARSTFLELEGFDERFQSPGGGLVNHDFLNRVLGFPAISPVVMLGEGTFHQIHGGVATNVPLARHPDVKFKEEYQAIRGKAYKRLDENSPFYLGKLPIEAIKFVKQNTQTGPSQKSEC